MAESTVAAPVVQPSTSASNSSLNPTTSEAPVDTTSTFRLDDPSAIPTADGFVLREWDIGDGTDELGVRSPASGQEGLDSLPWGFDLLSDGRVVVHDFVNEAWKVFGPNGVSILDTSALPTDEVWDFAITPNDIIFTITDTALGAYQLDGDSLVEIGSTGRDAQGVRGGFVRLTSQGASDTLARPNTISYDELAVNVPQPTPFAPDGLDESDVLTSSGRCAIEGGFTIAGYGNCIDGQILMITTTDGNTFELVAVILRNGRVVAGVREPEARRNIDGSFSTFDRLRPDGLYVFRQRTDDPADGFVLLRYDLAA